MKLAGVAVAAALLGMVLPAQAPRGGVYADAYEPDDSTGFVPIFDGKTLNGWDGDMTFWRAEDGKIVGETTPEKVVKVNNFLIWRGGVVKDFELKVEFKLSGTNSGIQYRSVELPEVGKWVLKGYQADMEFRNGYTGNLHEERGHHCPRAGDVADPERAVGERDDRRGCQELHAGRVDRVPDARGAAVPGGVPEYFVSEVVRGSFSL
jgi:hypothetical protein